MFIEKNSKIRGRKRSFLIEIVSLFHYIINYYIIWSAMVYDQMLSMRETVFSQIVMRAAEVRTYNFRSRFMKKYFFFTNFYHWFKKNFEK